MAKIAAVKIYSGVLNPKSYYGGMKRVISSDVRYTPLSKVSQKASVEPAILRFHKNNGRSAYYPDYPADYLELVSEEYVKGIPEKVHKHGNFEYKTPAFPGYTKKKYNIKPHYEIDTLISTGKGSGTKAVQDVVRKSLADKDTNGRVVVYAECIDGHSYPAGFYYKLGFRFYGTDRNKEMESWIINGGKRESAPTISGKMQLLKENIEHCLNYGK